MAGIYIHIPYCRKACSYCNFHFSTNLKTKSELIQTLLLQIKTDDFVSDRTIETIYFGGGTPSLLTEAELQNVLSTIYEHYKVIPNAEITLEANPDDVTSGLADFWMANGVNRISLGIQSFFDEDLHFMNRAHNQKQTYEAIKILQTTGFKNITIDLIYGGPTTSHEMWKQNLQTAIGFGIPHISSYCLTVEPKTVLDHQVRAGSILIDELKATEQFEILIDTMEQAGVDHYEISNFGKPGYYSRHNTSYWQNKHYHGFGPGAHSYNGISRKWMISNNALYIQNYGNNESCYEIETLTPRDQYNEYIMTRIRTQWGISFNDIRDLFGDDFAVHLQSAILQLDPETIDLTADTLKLSRKGKFFADRIASDLFIL